MTNQYMRLRYGGTMHAISYGGGVQSTSLLVLAATGRIDFPLALMANTGDDSEHPATLKYVREVAIPYAEANGIEIRLLDRHKRDGTVETLMGRLTREGSRSLPIPVRMSNGAPGTRSCTVDFKIKVLGKELKRLGATADEPATVAVGISLDEIHRVNNRKVEPHERIVYPLLDHDPPLRRGDCARIIRDAGLPVPPKSACYFCPFHRPSTWQDMRRDEPALFEQSADLEDLLNKRRASLGKDPVYLTRFNMPLRDAIADNAALLPLFAADDVGCDNGMCFT
jgi:hypothetical protein